MLGVDPGVHACGVAWMLDGAIVRAELRPTAGPPAPVLGGDTAAHVEIMQIYRHGKVRTVDLVNVSAAAGRMAALHTPRYYRPAQWKGQLSKDKQHARMWKVLTAPEILLLEDLECAEKLRHNVYDAVCILLKRTGRLR